MESLNKSEIAGALGVTRNTVDSWVRKGCPYVSRGRNGKEWRFNLDDVEKWRYRQQGKEDQGYHYGSDIPIMREMSARIIGDFFTWLINDAGPAWSGMVKEIGISDSKFIRKLYVLTFVIMNFSVHQLLRTQLRQDTTLEMPELIRIILEEDTDIRNAVVKFCQDKK